MSSTTTLVEDLRQKPPSEERDQLVRDAEAAVFHDFSSPYAFPKLVLAGRLRKAGFHDLVARARAGVYDDDLTDEGLPELPDVDDDDGIPF